MKKTKIKGLYLIENFLTQTEEKFIVEIIRNSEWKKSRSGRRCQVYGAFHDRNYTIIPGRSTPFPIWHDFILTALEELSEDIPVVNEYLTNKIFSKLSSNTTSEIFVNEYCKGDSLYPHFDHRTTYDDSIFGVSLLSSASLTFSRGKEKIKVKIPKRSIYIMSGESRFSYRHSVEPVAKYRLSITLRTIRG